MCLLKSSNRLSSLVSRLTVASLFSLSLASSSSVGARLIASSICRGSCPFAAETTHSWMKIIFQYRQNNIYHIYGIFVIKWLDEIDFLDRRYSKFPKCFNFGGPNPFIMWKTCLPRKHGPRQSSGCRTQQVHRPSGRCPGCRQLTLSRWLTRTSASPCSPSPSQTHRSENNHVGIFADNKTSLKCVDSRSKHNEAGLALRTNCMNSATNPNLKFQ